MCYAAAAAAAAAKSLQSCPTLCDPLDSSPPGSSVHRILQARILEAIILTLIRLFSIMEFSSLTHPKIPVKYTPTIHPFFLCLLILFFS